ncbi:MAG: T9SS type A sorting domain-containing protein [Bacteroidetes bacterium]|nr:T9SS type A sorting domain-containing protein [Bacteroidota bacterium]MCW5897156.1 T9SS type A sorting domain-containing protein [Bacteroidota bacterium]
MYRSTDNGISWQSLGQSFYNVLSAIELANDSMLIGTEKNGVFATIDAGLSWFSNNGGFKKASVTALVVTPSGYVLAGRSGPGAGGVGGTGGGMFRSTDRGEHWIQTSATAYSSHSITLKNNNTVFYSATVGIYRSTDEGATWGWSAHVDKYINGIAVDTNGNVYATAQWATYPGSFRAFYRSTDDGSTWVDIGACLDNPGFLARSLRNEFFGVTSQNSPYYAMFYRRSVSSGCTPVHTGLPNATGVRAVAFSQNGFTFVAHDSGVYRSTNNGGLWTGMNAGLPSRVALCLAFNRGEHLFVGTAGGGVFRSTDLGETWTIMNEGLTDLTVRSLATDASGYLFAGTDDGVFRTTSTTTEVIQQTGSATTMFTLEQNYPNPFNPRTTIKFQIPQSSFVTLRVFDLLGREVATLVDEVMQPGSYERVFHAEGLASGVYVYQLRGGGSVQSRKLLLLR